MRKIAVISLLFLSFGFVQDFSPQSKEITQKFFPELNIDIQTPAFKKSKGFTNYEEMMTFLNALKQQHPDVMDIKFIGESQKGKSIPMVMLNSNSSAKKLRVWFQGGLHGDEMASTEGMFYLLDRL
jgi:murein tripeptide amidase MpaA